MLSQVKLNSCLEIALFVPHVLGNFDALKWSILLEVLIQRGITTSDSDQDIRGLDLKCFLLCTYQVFGIFFLLLFRVVLIDFEHRQECCHKCFELFQVHIIEVSFLLLPASFFRSVLALGNDGLDLTHVGFGKGGHFFVDLVRMLVNFGLLTYQAGKLGDGLFILFHGLFNLLFVV